jgi:Ca2+/Na+ antiporter
MKKQGFQHGNQHQQTYFEYKKQVKICSTNNLNNKQQPIQKPELKDIDTQTNIPNIMIDDTLKKAFPMLYEHSLACYHNALMGRNSFPKYLKKLYVLLSFVGDSFYDILVQVFGFPSIPTFQCYKLKFQTELGLSLDLFLPTRTNIENNIRRFIKDCDDKCVVLALDALSLQSYISITKKGMVSGFANMFKISEETVTQVINEPNEFLNYIEKSLCDIINNAFVIYINSVDPTAKSFPLIIIPANNGAANYYILDILTLVQQILKENRIEILGISADGDKKYNSLFQPICKKFNSLSNFDINIPLFENFMDYTLIPFFSDILHLLKIVRYRFVEGTELYLFPFTTYKIGRKDFHLAGISEYLLCDKRAQKMEYCYPLKMFTFKYLKNIIEIERPDLLFVFLPWVTLIIAIFHQDVSRSERINLLQLTFCFILLYYLSLKYYFKTKKHSNPHFQNILYPQQQNRTGSKDLPKETHHPITLLDKGACKKTLSVVYFLICELSKNTTMHIRSFSTHFLGNFFGLIRKLDHNDNRFNRFLQSCTRSVLLSELKQDYGLQIRIPSRISDSGATIKESDIDEILPLEQHIKFAMTFISQFTTTSCFSESDRSILLSIIENVECVYIITDILKFQTKQSKEFISTTSECINKTGGLNNDKCHESWQAIKSATNEKNTHKEGLRIFQSETNEIISFIGNSILYRFNNEINQWTSRCKGSVAILQSNETKRYRILMRDNQTFVTRINHIIYQTLKFSQQSDRDQFIEVFHRASNNVQNAMQDN